MAFLCVSLPLIICPANFVHFFVYLELRRVFGKDNMNSAVFFDVDNQILRGGAWVLSMGNSLIGIPVAKSMAGERFFFSVHGHKKNAKIG